MLTTKIHRHDALSTIAPPINGPAIVAMPVHEVHDPMARVR
jgi:hypothetical protein